jgi:imidazolonepropionase-like amidohydrolase
MNRPVPTLPAAALLAALLAAAAAPATAADPTRATAPEPVVAFVGVHVVPMDRERVLERQTVIVRGDRIEAVGPVASVRVPAGATRIDGSGRWLIPGLAEMHAHIPGASAPAAYFEELLFLYVANGVTTIRGMLGAPNQLELRARTASGELLGPTILVGAPSLNGNSAPDSETARRLVRGHHAAGYDFLKLHGGFGRAVYDAIVDEARRVGITWAGHVDGETGIRHAIATRQSTVDHLDGYLQAAVPDDVAAGLAPGGAGMLALLRAVEPARLAALADATREAGVWNVPTMALWETFNSPHGPEHFLQWPELVYATPQQREQWTQQKRNMLASQAAGGMSDEARELNVLRRRQLLKALADAGAPLLLGTDSPQLFSVPGFSLHRELRVMAEAGLTPFQILEAGTRNVARYTAGHLGGDGAFGTIAAGQRADLILLDANPLDDVAHVARRAGVMVRGQWLPESEIQRRLAEIAAANRG